jgi:hypothetical protein
MEWHQEGPRRVWLYTRFGGNWYIWLHVIMADWRTGYFINMLFIIKKRESLYCSGVPRNFVLGRGGGSTNSDEDRGQRELWSGDSSPLVRVSLNLQMSETRILIRLFRMYFPRNWEFGSALSKLRNFGEGGLNPPTLPSTVSHCFIDWLRLGRLWLQSPTRPRILHLDTIVFPLIPRCTLFL